MAGTLIELNEAAAMLGVSPHELVEMCDRREIHGYRDGSSWMFKLEEVQRFAAERVVRPAPQKNTSPSDSNLAIEGSSLNLADSSFSNLDCDLGLSSVGNDLNAADESGDGSDLVLDLDDSLDIEESSEISPHARLARTWWA